MRRGVRWWPFAVLAVPIGWNAWWMRAELGSVSYVNDNAFHQAVLRWMHGRLESGDHSLDGWFPGVNLGYPVTHHYQTAPHRVAAYLAEITGSDRVIAISTVLLLAAWPIALYVALRRWGFGRIGAVAAASLAPFISSMSGPREGGQMLTGYGYEFESYLWRGNGVWTQLIGMWLLPFALALTYRAVHDGRYRIAAPVVLAATVCCHFITGYFALLCLGVWVLIAPLEARRWWRAFEVGGAAVLMSAWVVVPLLSDSAYTAQLASMQNTYWMDSWGLGEAVTRAATGNLFDFGIEVGRFPILTVLAGIGLGVAVVRARRSVPHRAALGLSAVALVLFAGRPTFGPVLNLLPGGRDLLLHRYILAVHMAGIVLIAIAAAEIPALGAAVERLAERIGGGRLRFGSPAGRSAAIGGVIGVAVVVGAMPAVAERTHYLEVDTAWIHAQQAADAQDGPALRRLFASARAHGPGRIYAGALGGWGASFQVDQSPMYMQATEADLDTVGFWGRTLTWMADVEPALDDSSQQQLDLMGVRYELLESDSSAPPQGTRLAAAGRFVLYELPTSGYVGVADVAGPAINATRSSLGRAASDLFGSSAFADGALSPLSIDGAHPMPVTRSTAVEGRAGTVVSSHVVPAAGRFEAVVNAERTAAVFLKTGYHGRMRATVDGVEVQPSVVAPGFPAIRVGAGSHTVVFHYEPYPAYPLWGAVGVATLVALVLAQRRRSRSAALEDESAGPPSQGDGPAGPKGITRGDRLRLRKRRVIDLRIPARPHGAAPTHASGVGVADWMARLSNPEVRAIDTRSTRRDSRGR